MKRYKAATDVSVNVNVGGSSERVCFTSVTAGGSVFYTDNPELQKALEGHYRYGSLFVEDKSYATEATKAKAEETKSPEAKAPEAKEFADFQEAKEWLSETFGIPRSNLKSKKHIETAAAEHGVKIEYTTKE